MSQTTPTAAHLGDLRDVRYGEILLISPGDDGSLEAAVYNTIGLNDCPLDRWRALDPESLAQQFAVPVVYLNGPRFWLFDELSAFVVGEVATFGGIEARRVAKVRIPAGLELTHGPGKEAYVDIVVERDTEYRFLADRPVHSLLTPDGKTYVMQAYSQIVDPGQTIGSLAGLGERLSLPQGWRYQVDTPTEDLLMRPVAGEAHVLQDELENTYMLLAH
ncbi:hypothetical protein ACFY1J_02135 [Streptomyces sp. NPDC001406]|uniref:hypothetical protein n=1 Tax=Streptomyces sp. NPDC001406 TaxID=3364572 RepID=UPI0036B73092